MFSFLSKKNFKENFNRLEVVGTIFGPNLSSCGDSLYVSPSQWHWIREVMHHGVESPGASANRDLADPIDLFCKCIRIIDLRICFDLIPMSQRLNRYLKLKLKVKASRITYDPKNSNQTKYFGRIFPNSDNTQVNLANIETHVWEQKSLTRDKDTFAYIMCCLVVVCWSNMKCSLPFDFYPSAVLEAAPNRRVSFKF